MGSIFSGAGVRASNEASRNCSISAWWIVTLPATHHIQRFVSALVKDGRKCVKLTRSSCYLHYTISPCCLRAIIQGSLESEETHRPRLLALP